MASQQKPSIPAQENQLQIAPQPVAPRFLLEFKLDDTEQPNYDQSLVLLCQKLEKWYGCIMMTQTWRSLYPSSQLVASCSCVLPTPCA